MEEAEEKAKSKSFELNTMRIDEFPMKKFASVRNVFISFVHRRSLLSRYCFRFDLAAAYYCVVLLCLSNFNPKLKLLSINIFGSISNSQCGLVKGKTVIHPQMKSCELTSDSRNHIVLRNKSIIRFGVVLSS